MFVKVEIFIKIQFIVVHFDQRYGQIQMNNQF